jgi:hypothetical protein
MAFFDRPLFMWRKYERVTDQEENETSDLKVGTTRRAYARSRGNSLIWMLMTLVLVERRKVSDKYRRSLSKHIRKNAIP